MIQQLSKKSRLGLTSTPQSSLSLPAPLLKILTGWSMLKLSRSGEFAWNLITVRPLDTGTERGKWRITIHKSRILSTIYVGIRGTVNAKFRNLLVLICIRLFQMYVVGAKNANLSHLWTRNTFVQTACACRLYETQFQVFSGGNNGRSEGIIPIFYMYM